MKRKDVADEEDEAGLVVQLRRRRQQNTNHRADAPYEQPLDIASSPPASPPTNLDITSSPPASPPINLDIPSSPGAATIQTPTEGRSPELQPLDQHTPSQMAPEDEFRLFKLSSSPVRVLGTHVDVNASFTDASSANVCTVDKSLFCIGFWEMISLSGRICLPRRSGKTYNLTQLLLFFSCAPEEMHVDDRDYLIEDCNHSAEQIRLMSIAQKCRLKRKRLFRDSLLREKHPAFVEEHFMKYPVIHISFSLCKGASPGSFISKLYDAIATSAKHWLRQYTDIEGVDTSRIADYARELSIILDDCRDARKQIGTSFELLGNLITPLFKCLSELVRKCVGKYILLVDEYDVPFITAHLASWDSNQKKDIQASLKCLMQEMFKDNINLRKGLLVGVFDIPLSELGSGANNIVDIPMVPFKDVTGNGSIANAALRHSGKGLDALTDSFWFNTKEVGKLLDQSAIRFPQIAEHKDSIMSVIRSWYNGYHIGRFKGKYNPWSVCAFIGRLCSHLDTSEDSEPRSVSDAMGLASRAYWVATGTTDVIEDQFKKHSQQAISLMKCLISEYRRTRIGIHDPDISTGSSQAVSLKLPKPDMGIISTGEYSNERMLSLCLFAGYLTHKYPDAVCIPNHEVYDVWCTLFTRMVFSTDIMSSNSAIISRGSLLVELWKGRTARLHRFIKDALRTLAKHRKYKENEYANVVATALTAASCLGAFSHPDQRYSRVSDAVTTRENYTGEGFCDHLMWLYSTSNLPNQFCAVIEYKFIPDDRREDTDHHKYLANKALKQIIDSNYMACVSGCVERIDIGIAVGNNVLHILSKLYTYDEATHAWIQVPTS